MAEEPIGNILSGFPDHSTMKLAQMHGQSWGQTVALLHILEKPYSGKQPPRTLQMTKLQLMAQIGRTSLSFSVSLRCSRLWLGARHLTTRAGLADQLIYNVYS